MELVTMHTHTNYTGHGSRHGGRAGGRRRGSQARRIAVTEHYPMSAAMDPDNVVSMAWDRLPDYLIDIAAAAAAHPEMQVIPGCEIDWLGAQEDRDFSALDFMCYLAALKGLDRRAARRRSLELLETVGLATWRGRRCARSRAA